jgi:hypothetical protein
MEHYGSLEAMEQINLHIRLTESPGLGPVLEMPYLPPMLVQSHGMELYGSLEEQGRIT